MKCVLCASCSLEVCFLTACKRICALFLLPSFHPSPCLPPSSQTHQYTHTTGQGAVVGVTDFVLRRLRSFQGVVASTNCTVVEISRAALEVMVTEVPEVATAMQVRVGVWRCE